MPGEEDLTTKLGSSSAHLTASIISTTTVPVVVNSTYKSPAKGNTSTTANTGPCFKSDLPSATSGGCVPASCAGSSVKTGPFSGPTGQGRLEHENDEEDRSKLELELQFAGIDNETAELDLEDDDNNLDSANGGKTLPSPHPSIGGSGRGSVTLGCGGSSVGGVVPLDEEEDEDVEAGKTVECTEVIVPIQTLAEKCLFYITAFFILLAVFSLFAFLFLVPFVIDPAFSTLFMEFDPEPAFCLTVSNVALRGSSNCNWTSCREGCTREMFSCTQIRVNYRRAKGPHNINYDPAESSSGGSGLSNAAGSSSNSKKQNYQPYSSSSSSNINFKHSAALEPRSGYSNNNNVNNKKRKHKWSSGNSAGELTRSGGSGQADPNWDYKGAHLKPNVKGCGYPPVVVCSAFDEMYGPVGTNFSCFYSKVDPGLVVTSYDMSRVMMDLVYSMAIPIPSFIISVVYLIFAYFRIYNMDSSSSSTQRRGSSIGQLNVNQSSTNNNIGGGTGSAGDGDTSLSLADDKTKILAKSTSRGLNAVDKLIPNSGKQVIEMNDLNPSLHQNPADGDLLLPRRNNRAPERNGSANPAAKNKGGNESNMDSAKYLEPGVLPDKKSNVLPPIQLPPQVVTSTSQSTINNIDATRTTTTNLSTVNGWTGHQ